MRPFSPFFQRLRPRNYASLLSRLWSGGHLPDWERTVLRLTSNRPCDHEAVLHEWVAAARARPVSGRNAVRQLLAAASFRAPPRPPATRILLLASERDGLVNPACSWAIADTWGCALVCHPGAGHDLPLDEPAWVIDRVRQWVAPVA